MINQKEAGKMLALVKITKVSRMTATEKKLTIKLSVNGNFNHKAKHAIMTLRNELKKHFRNKECVISTAINEYIWNNGRVSIPSKVSMVSAEKNGKVYLFLDSKDDLKRKEEFLSGKKSDAPKKEVKEVKSDKKEQEKVVEKKEEKKPAKAKTTKQ